MGVVVGMSLLNCIGVVMFYCMFIKDFKVKIFIMWLDVKMFKDIVVIGAFIAVAGIVFVLVYVGFG